MTEFWSVKSNISWVTLPGKKNLKNIWITDIQPKGLQIVNKFFVEKEQLLQNSLSKTAISLLPVIAIAIAIAKL